MWEEILKAVPIYFSAMIKFVVGPIGGYAVGLNLLTTILTTVFSMMTVVIVLSFFGDFLRKKVFVSYFTKRKKFSVRNRKLVAIWKSYGLPGVAFLTPILLTPIGGTLLALSFGSPKNKLIFYMFLSAAVWSLIFSSAVYFFGNELISRFNLQWTP